MNPNGEEAGPSTGNSSTASNNDSRIKDVWANNLLIEMEAAGNIIKKYDYIAMNVVFPGKVANPCGKFNSTAEFMYHVVKCNVDMLNIIQLGITFFDKMGRLPDGPYTTWQFNFKFNLFEDTFPRDGIKLLMESGIPFKKHKEDGIDQQEFIRLIIPSGLLLNDDVKWITYQSNFDIGFLMKMLTNSKLPKKEKDFFHSFHVFFPKIYDTMYLMKNLKNFNGGLREISNKLQVPIIGTPNQASSNSLLVGMVFFKIRDLYFNGSIDDSKYCGNLFGLTIDNENVEID